MFTDRDLKDWRLSLSGKGTTFAIDRNDLEGLLDRLEAAEALIESAGDLKRDGSEESKAWLESSGKSFYGISIKTDPTLPPGKWKIKKVSNPEPRYIQEEDF